MERVRINLGKGVYVSAPVKKEMTIDEWMRMSDYLNSVLRLKR